MFQVIVQIANWVFECWELVEGKTFNKFEDARNYANEMMGHCSEYDVTFVVNGVSIPYAGERDFRRIIWRKAGV